MRALLLTAALAALAADPGRRPGPNHAATSPPLSPELVAAWQRAGATLGHLNTHWDGMDYFFPGFAGEEGEVPVFQFREWKRGVLAGLPQPQGPFGLDLRNTQIGDADLKELAALKELRYLCLAGCPVTGASLKDLAGLKWLQSLDLAATKVTDDGLKDLAALTGLQRLSLKGTSITDAALKYPGGLRGLQALTLGCTDVTDTGLKEVARLKGLQKLSVNGTQMTDVGLKELAALKELRELCLYCGPVTGNAVEELRKAIPGLTVNR